METSLIRPDAATQLQAATGAVFSACEQYRYLLWRHWDDQLPLLGFIGLNPATAGADADDPTIRRCRGFATELGFGGIVVANLFAFCTSHPHELFAAADPVGEENHSWLNRLSRFSAKRVAIWGNHGQAYFSNFQIESPIYCLKLNKSGAPAHPLYLPKGLSLKRFTCLE